MSEAPKAKLDLKLVDDAFVAPAGAPPAEQVKGQLAAAIREGIRRNKRANDQANAVMAASHAAALSAAEDAYAKAANGAHKLGYNHGLHKGVWIGLLLMFIAAGTAFAAYTVAILGPTFDAALQTRVQDDVVNTLDRAAGDER